MRRELDCIEIVSDEIQQTRWKRMGTGDNRPARRLVVRMARVVAPRTVTSEIRPLLSLANPPVFTPRPR